MNLVAFNIIFTTQGFVIILPATLTKVRALPRDLEDQVLLAKILLRRGGKAELCRSVILVDQIFNDLRMDRISCNVSQSQV